MDKFAFQQQWRATLEMLAVIVDVLDEVKDLSPASHAKMADLADRISEAQSHPL